MEVTDIDGVPTHVFSLEASRGNDSLLYIIPGSPGMAHFYVPFATRLFQLGGGAYDVSVVSHAGHSPGVYKTPLPPSQDEQGNLPQTCFPPRQIRAEENPVPRGPLHWLLHDSKDADVHRPFSSQEDFLSLPHNREYGIHSKWSVPASTVHHISISFHWHCLALGKHPRVCETSGS